MVFRNAYIGLAMSLLLLCCSKAPSPDQTPGEGWTLLDTKAAVPAYDGSNFTTFRTLLMDQDAPWRGVQAQGTYCNIYQFPSSSVGEKWYHPIRCNASGEPLTDGGTAIVSWMQTDGKYYANGSVPEYSYDWTSGDTWGNSSYALMAQDTLQLHDEIQHFMPYRFMAVSPAREMTSFQNGTRSGFLMSRKENLLVSSAIKVSLRGTSLSDGGIENQMYVYGLDGSEPALTMKEPRSKLTVKVYVDESLGEIALSKIIMDNFITEGIYMPVDETTGTSRWIYDWDGNPHLFSNVSGNTEDEDGDTSCYDLTDPVLLKYRADDGTINAPLTALHDFYILSQDYSQLNQQGMPVHPLPTVKVMFAATGSEGEVPIPIPLSWNFEPQHHYTFTIRIATWHLYLYVQGSNWDTDEWSSIDHTFGVEPDQIIYLEHPLSGGNPWENGGGGTGTI